MAKGLPILQSTECRCVECSDGCHKHPGWFAPGQVEELAKHFGCSVKELFDKALTVEFWAGGIDDHETDVYTLAPINGTKPGEVAPFGKPSARCVFLDSAGDCAIHEFRPKECAITHHDMGNGAYVRWREDNVREWLKHQDEIVELLGEAPPERDMLEMVSDALEMLVQLAGEAG